MFKVVVFVQLLDIMANIDLSAWFGVTTSHGPSVFAFENEITNKEVLFAGCHAEAIQNLIKGEGVFACGGAICGDQLASTCFAWLDANSIDIIAFADSSNK